MRPIILLLVLYLPLAASAGHAIEGRYWTEDRNGMIEMYRAGDQLSGRIVWRSSPLLDRNNPDPSLRGRSMVGVTFLTGFTKKGSKWEGGEVYSADNGRTYRGKLWLEDDGLTLKMRGFVGVSLFGRTASFSRVAANEPMPEGK
ncbi:MAG: DUF2147 domain-containing protein [Pseudomonadota bacterium]